MTGHWEWGNCLRFEIGTYQESETCAPKSIAANFWSDIPSHPSRSLRISAALLATARGELAAPLFRSARLRQNGFSPGLRRERCWILSRTSCWWRDSLSQSNERLARKVKCSSSIVWSAFRDDRHRHDAEGVTRRVSPRGDATLRECKSRPVVRGWCLDTAVLFAVNRRY
jgi:hypothetical protein